MVCLPSILAQLSWRSPDSWWLSGAIVLAVAASVIWLYPAQVRSLGRPWRWVLPGLRAGALGVLAVAVLQPVVVRQARIERDWAIIILVDASRSMSVSDTRSPGELVALADGLGLLESGSRWDASRGLQTSVERAAALADELERAQGELEYARLAGRGMEAARSRVDRSAAQLISTGRAAAARAASAPRLAEAAAPLRDLESSEHEAGSEPWLREVRDRIGVLAAAVAAEQAMADEQVYRADPRVRRVCDELARLSRWSLVEAAVTRSQASLLEHLPAGAPLYGFVFDEQLRPIELRDGGEAAQRLAAAPQGHASDITGALREALDRLKGQALQAVIIFSDGRQVPDGAASAMSAAAPDVPVFTVASAVAEVRDVWLEGSAPSSAFTGETITVSTRVYSRGFDGEAVEVHLAMDDLQLKQSAELTGEEPTMVRFEVPLRTSGARRIVLSVPEIDGETSAENNRIERWVKIFSHKLKVMVIAGAEKGRDLEHLIEALAQAAWAEAFEITLLDESPPDISTERILRQDVIVLYDMAMQSLDEVQWDAVHQLVAERGGSVMLLPRDERRLRGWGEHLLLSNLLPYRSDARPAWRMWPGERPSFHLVPGLGEELPEPLHLDMPPAEARRAWQGMPGMLRYLPAGELRPQARALLVERESGAAVLTEMPVGLGRAFFFGADEAWRWREALPEEQKDIFWLGLIAHAGEAPYLSAAGGVALDVERVSLSPGQGVRVRARVMDEQGLPSLEDEQVVQIVRDGQVVRGQTLPMHGRAGSGRYEGIIAGLPEGEYELRLSDPEQASELAEVAVPLYIAASYETEMVDLSGDTALLRRLADASGGAMIPLEQVQRLAEKIAEAHERMPRFVEYSLWDSGWLFLLVLGCLGAEWALRKQFGLA